MQTKLWINCKDGVKRLFQINFSLWKNNVLISVFNEITDKEQYQELEKLSKVKDRLLSIVAHDVRNVLNSLQGLIEMFLEGDISEENFSELIVDLSVQNDKVRHLLENLITWTKRQWGREQFLPEEVSMKEIAGLMKELFNQDLNQKKIQLDLNMPQDDILAFADRQMVEIILRNLISNAIKFTPSRGKIEVTIDKINDFAQIRVKDTGIGMSKEKIRKIMEGEMLSHTGTNGEIGTGLGLSLCMEYANKNQGRIDVFSKEREGSEFVCYLPLAQN